MNPNLSSYAPSCIVHPEGTSVEWRPFISLDTLIFGDQKATQVSNQARENAPRLGDCRPLLHRVPFVDLPGLY